MVRPVPPNNASSSTVVDSANGNEVDDSGLAQENADANNRLSNADIQHQFGPRISLRDSNGNNPSSPERTNNSEGAFLYRGFLNDEFRRRNLPEPAELLPRESSYHRMGEPTSSDLIRAGNQLSSLSDEFSHSPMRQWVEGQASRVPLDNIDFNSFSELLYGLFQEGGVTWERLVVLFYFCTDLAARSLREKLPQQFQNIVEWSFRFFSGDRLSSWVAQNGGWISVLHKSVNHLYQVTKLGFIILGIVAFASYIWKSR